MPHLNVKQLRDLLTELIEQAEPQTAEMPVILGRDPEGNPPFHAFCHENTEHGAGLAFVKAKGEDALILWAGYPQYWDDDLVFPDED